MEQPVVPPPMPPQGPPVRRAPQSWKQRFLSGNNGKGLTLRQELTMPNWLTGKATAFFFIAMFACWMAFGYVPGIDLVLVSCISVLIFFYIGSAMLKSWSHVKEKRFLMNTFWMGVIIRIIFVSYMFLYFNPTHYDTTYGSGEDVSWYMPFGEAIAQWVRNGFDMTFGQLQQTWSAAIDDVGYPIWLGVVYLFTGSASDVYIPFMVKALLGAYCTICVYRVAKRHFGEGTARLAAIFVSLNPNMIYWCGTMMKETEMLFLVCLAVDNFDRVLSSGQKYTFKALLPGMLAALALMFFRTVLAMVLFIAVFAHVVMASQRVMSIGKKFLAGILVALVLAVSMGDRIRTQSKELIEATQSDARQNRLQARAHSNSFAKYASAAVFAPLIFTIPFPTMNQALETQYTQMQLAGGSYIKNILSFFVIWVLFIMLISGEWRRHVFLIAYTIGYLMVLVMSSFAQSGRFHMPIWPMLMMFGAYGVQLGKTTSRIRRWYMIALVLEVVACLTWNWYKLAGRGLV